MTKTEFANLAECEGWEYILTAIGPGQLEDAGLAEALNDAQEAFKILVEGTPEATLSFFDKDEDDLEELDFG